MKQAFKESYERELLLLKERAALFAKDYPGLADRLGGLLEENLDPSIAGLLEGSAFLAARVQLNIDQQFRTFSTELLEQVSPEMTAPVPAAMLVQGHTPEKPAEIAEGRTINAGSYIEATFTEATRRIACRFRLAELREDRAGEVTFRQEVTVEIEGGGKPALVADWIGRVYLQEGAA